MEQPPSSSPEKQVSDASSQMTEAEREATYSRESALRTFDSALRSNHVELTQDERLELLNSASDTKKGISFSLRGQSIEILSPYKSSTDFKHYAGMVDGHPVSDDEAEELYKKYWAAANVAAGMKRKVIRRDNWQ